jgi:predicted GIY-YIG superfamily endonuclease
MISLVEFMSTNRGKAANSPRGTASHDYLYFEETRDVHAALTREKQVKGWTRAKKLELINTDNPKWMDLSVEWDVS